MELSMWDVAAVGIKAILYAATLCASGGVFFLLYTRSLVFLRQQRSIRRWVGLCVLVAVTLSALRLSIVAGSMSEGLSGMVDGPMVRMVLQAGEARASGIRIVGLLLAGTVLLETRRGLILASVGALMAATSFVWIGHAWAAKDGGISIALLSIHLLGVAFWFGALVPLLLVGRDASFETFACTAQRFGDIAVYGVALLLLAGALLLVTFIGHVSNMWITDYGRLVTIKLVGVAALLSAAALNKLRFTPRLLAHDTSAARTLRRSIQIEMLLGVVILAVTASFTTLTGPPTLE